MKLVFSIVHDEDAPKVVEELNKESHSVTKLCSTGGFLRAGNTTLLIGIRDEDVDEVLTTIAQNSKKRLENMKSPVPAAGRQIEVGGATVFILDVERFEKF